MRQMHSKAWYFKLYQLRLNQHYLAEAQRMVNLATSIEQKNATMDRPQLRIVK
jgi:hypothetical protein